MRKQNLSEQLSAVRKKAVWLINKKEEERSTQRLSPSRAFMRQAYYFTEYLTINPVNAKQVLCLTALIRYIDYYNTTGGPHSLDMIIQLGNEIIIHERHGFVETMAMRSDRSATVINEAIAIIEGNSPRIKPSQIVPL